MPGSEGVFHTDEQLIGQERPELRMPLSSADHADGKQLGVISQKVLNNIIELSGSVVEILGPAERQVEDIPNISVDVLEQHIMPP